MYFTVFSFIMQYQNIFLQGGCKFLYVLKRYTQSANYYWMFCEGFYLHRLIVRAFEIPKSLVIYYIIGIGKLKSPVILKSTKISSRLI